MFPFRRKNPVKASAKTSGACGLSKNVMVGCAPIFVMTPSFGDDVWRSDDGGKTWRITPVAVCDTKENALPFA
jgi:hypothetical protein